MAAPDPAAPTSVQQNPVVNASFESGAVAPEGWMFSGQKEHVRASWAREGAHSGTRCLAFFPEMTSAAWESAPVPVAAGRPYGLTWWTRFEGSVPWHWSYHCEFIGAAVRFLGADGREISRVERKFYCLATAGWQQAWIKFTPPAGAQNATVAFVYRTGIESDGRVWVDDVALELLDPLPPLPEGCARIILKTTDEQGKRLSARMWVRTEAGENLFPKYCSRFSVPDVGFHAAPQDCWLDVPAGALTAGARRGFEYAPAQESVRLKPGEKHEVRLALRRTIDMRAQGWLAGDHHCHLFFHKNTQHPQMTPQDVFEIAKAEGLNYLSLDGEMIEFRANLGDHQKARDEGFVGEMGLEAVTDFYGHVCLLNVRQDMPGGFPMRMAFWPTNEMVHAFAQSQGGATICAHPLEGASLQDFLDAVADPRRGIFARELAVDALLGSRFAFDIYSHYAPPQRLANVLTAYYNLLNAGSRIGATASTDYYIDQGRGPCGTWRTYARAEELDFASIAKAYREGRTFATNGPLVLFSIGSVSPGDEVTLAKPGEVDVSLRAESQWGLDAAELVVNGEVKRRWKAVGGRLDVTDRVHVAETSWVAARVFGPKSPAVDSSPMADEPGQSCGQFAHTSPIYVRVGNAAFRPRRTAVKFCLAWAEAMAKAVNAVRDRYMSADISPYGLTGAEAFGRVMSRIVEAKRRAEHMLASGALADE